MSNTVILTLAEYKWPVGSHIPLHDTLYQSVKIAVNLNQSTVQFFLGNPYKFDRRELSENDLEKTRSLIKRYNIKVFSHAPYVHNLAGNKDNLAWEKNDKINDKLRVGMNSLEKELEILSKLGGGVVIHPGTFKDKKKCLETVIKTLNNIKYSKNSMLLLENCAGEGSKIFSTISELKIIFDGIKENIYDNIFVCIDTCHIFSAGVYDFGSVQDVDAFFEEFISLIGIDKLKLIHLNDSKGTFGCKKDRHELIGKGHIWKKDRKGLDKLIEYCIKYNIPTIMETGSVNVEDIFY